MHYLLFYEKASDYAEREGALQKMHLEHVLAAVAREELMLGGPLADPTDGENVLLFQVDNAKTVEAFAKDDPYVVGGIVIRWHVREWHTVVGVAAAFPLSLQN